MNLRRGEEKGWEKVRCSNSTVTSVLCPLVRMSKPALGWAYAHKTISYTRHSPHLEEGPQSFKQYQICGEVDKMCIEAAELQVGDVRICTYVCRSLCITCMHTHLTRAHLIQQYSQYIHTCLCPLQAPIPTLTPSKHLNPTTKHLHPPPSTLTSHQASSPPPTNHPHPHKATITPHQAPSPPTKHPHPPTKHLHPPPSTFIPHQAPSPHVPHQACSPTHLSLGTQTQRVLRGEHCQEPRCCDEVGGHGVLLEVGV